MSSTIIGMYDLLGLFRPITYYSDRHEDLYVKMRESETILTTHELKEKRKQGKIDETFAGIRVILCTLAMLTAPPLRDIDLHARLPPHSLIVDEASQITMSDFLPAMYLLGEHIRRLGFVGDPKQRKCRARLSESPD